MDNETKIIFNTISNKTSEPRVPKFYTNSDTADTDGVEVQVEIKIFCAF